MAKLVGQFSGFEQDMAALEKQVKDAFRASRPALAEEMRQCLREHVVEDVYDKLVPEEYVRRRGTKGLADMNASATVYSDERDGGMNLTLLYHPSGATDGNGEPINPHVDGDDLVNRIEKNDPAYNWGRRPKNTYPFPQLRGGDAGRQGGRNTGAGHERSGPHAGAGGRYRDDTGRGRLEVAYGDFQSNGCT